MVAAGIGEGAGYADADRGRAAEQRIGVGAGGVALHQHLALEGVALHRVAAGVKQIGVAAEDLAVTEHNHAAALAGAAIQQADVDRIQPVLHDVPMPAAAPTETGMSFMPNRGPQRQRGRLTAALMRHLRNETLDFAVNIDAMHDGSRRAESSWPVKCMVCPAPAGGCWSNRQVSNWINSGGLRRVYKLMSWYNDGNGGVTVAAHCAVEAPLKYGFLCCWRAGFAARACARSRSVRQFQSRDQGVVRQLEKREGAVLFGCRWQRGQRCRLGIRQRTLPRADRRRMDRRARRGRDHRAQPRRPNHGVADPRLWRADDPLLHAG